MAKFSWRHPLRSIGRLLGITPTPPVPPTPPPPPPPPPEPPTGGGGGGGGGNYEFDSERRAIWAEITGQNALDPLGSDYWDLFSDTGIPARTEYRDTNRAFSDFLQSFWLTSDEPGSIPRAQFYEDWDTPADLIDWDFWREIKKT